MRASALFRWGLTCLLLAPLAFLSWLLSPGVTAPLQPTAPDILVTVATTWGVLAPIVAVLLVLGGGALNLLAIRRGVRGLDRLTLTGGARDADGTPGAPGASRSGAPRILYPDDWDEQHPDGHASGTRSLSRSSVGAILASALLIWAVYIGWVLLVEHPLSFVGDALSLEQVYAAWNPVSRAGFVVSVTVWAVLAVLSVLAIAVLGRLPRPGLDRLLAPRRFTALTAILASALVVAAQPALFTLGISLVDDLNRVLESTVAGGPSAGSWHILQWGIAFSALAIVLTVPSWRRRRGTEADATLRWGPETGA